MLKAKIKEYWLPLAILIIWELILLLTRSSWTNFFLLPLGAILGYFLLTLSWFSFKPIVKKRLPLILLPLTIFILTSTAGIFGKALIIFLNLKIILDNLISKENNQFKAEL